MRKIDKDKIKTWFVTGASSGIGKEMCLQLLQRGYNVVAVSRRMPSFSDYSDSKNLLCLSVDVTSPVSIQEAINKGILKFKKIDVLVNNAGISASVTCEEENLEHMKQVMETNFFGTYNTISALLPHFRQNHNGTIVNNTSMHGLSVRYGGSAYCSSKHAVEALTSVLHLETCKFCRIMAFELGLFLGTEIGTHINKQTEIEEYKNIPSDYKHFYYSFNNQIPVGVSLIIDEVEKEKMQRYFILGKDAYIKIKHQLSLMKGDIKKSKRKAYRCSKFDNKFILKIIRKIIRIIFKKEIFKDI